MDQHPQQAQDKKKPIKNVRIDHSIDWFTPFWNGIYHTFHSFPYFDYFEDELKAVFEDVRSSTFLIDFNLMVLNKILRWLELNITYQLASEVTYELNKKTIIYQEYKSKNYIHRLEDSECVKIKHPTFLLSQNFLYCIYYSFMVQKALNCLIFIEVYHCLLLFMQKSTSDISWTKTYGAVFITGLIFILLFWWFTSTL